MLCAADFLRLSIRFSAFHLLSLIFLFHSPALHLHLSCGRLEPCALLRMMTSASWSRTIHSQVVSPTSSTSQRLLKNTSRSPLATDSEPSYSCDAEFDDETMGKALSSPLFIQEREEPANLGQVYHSYEKNFLQLRTGRPFSDQFDSLIPNVRQNPRRGSENEQIRILLERQKEQILANYQAKIRKKTNSTLKNFPNVGWSYRVSQKGILSCSSRRRTTSTRSTTSSWTFWNKIGIFVKLMRKVLMKRFQGSTYRTISRRKLVEDPDTFSLTWRTRNSKRPSRKLERNRTHQWFPLCFAR